MNGTELRAVQSLFRRLIRAKYHEFPPPRRKVDAPIDQGVYIIDNPSNAVEHVGRTYRGKRGLAQRLRNHLSGSSTFCKKYLRPNSIDLRTGYRFRYIIVENDRLRAPLENYATGHLCPKHLGTGSKNEMKEQLTA